MSGISQHDARKSVGPHGYLVALTWALGSTLLGAFLIWGSSGASDRTVRRDAAPSRSVRLARTPASPGAAPLLTKAIEGVQLGERVRGTNPELDDSARAIPDPDPTTWRRVSLRLTKADGSPLEIDLLRPLGWIEGEGADVGTTIALDLPELGASGPAEVLAVGPCPPIAPGEGNVVTGRFMHRSSANLLDLRLEGQAEVTGVTANHPFWSVDRRAFVPAGELQVGERLDTASGAMRVASITPRAGDEPVYNLEVHREHVYQVTMAGVLVHNNCITGSIRGKTPNKVAEDILSRESAWKKGLVDQGHGWKIVDENNIERMRYMYPQKEGKYLHEQAGYFVRQDAKGRFLDIDGSIIPDGPEQITLRHLFDTSP